MHNGLVLSALESIRTRVFCKNKILEVRSIYQLYFVEGRALKVLVSIPLLECGRYLPAVANHQMDVPSLQRSMEAEAQGAGREARRT